MAHKKIYIRNRIQRWHLVLFLVALTALLIISASGLSAVFRPGTADLGETAAPSSLTPETDTLNRMRLTDNRELYTQYPPDDVVNIFVTVYTGTDPATGIIYDFDKMNTIRTKEEGNPALKATVKIEDPAVPGKYIVGGEAVTPNCLISQRGDSARLYSNKSYKIKIFDDEGTFRGQSVLNLNKHMNDDSRIRQKYCFDWLAQFEDMVSLRTTFVRLYVMDATKGENVYADYGLFTHVEQPNRDFMSSHGLDVNGTLYKPDDFEFFREEDVILPEDDPGYDYELFSQLLRIRENSDNVKLIKMLDDVNDMSLDFNEVFARYFDLDNYLTWIAANILFDNYDTMSRNFMLYSPANSDKWYFLPWDYDGTFVRPEEEENRYGFHGISRYYGSVLHKRFFRNPENLALLESKLDELKALMTAEKSMEMMSLYINAIRPVLKYGADIKNYGGPEGYESSILREAVFDSLTEYYYNRYYSTKGKPMPFFLGVPQKQTQSDGAVRWRFNWEPTYDLQGDAVTYSFQISESILFDSFIYREDDLYITEILIGELGPGIYYWRVIVADESGNTQIPYDYVRLNENDPQYMNVGSHKIFGCRRLVIE